MLTNTQLLPRTTESPRQRVWTKPTWAAQFTLRPDLVCTQTSSTIAPDVPTAALEYHYGLGLAVGTGSIGTYTPITSWGYYVLVEWFTATERRWWLGYAGKPVTTPIRAAAAGIPAAGIQRIPCVGLERSFELSTVRTTVHADPDTSEGADPFVRHTTATPFNPNRSGNRHDAGGVPIFALPRATPTRLWSRRQIVQHLLTYHLPTPSGMAAGIPWAIGDLTMIPDWDGPMLICDNRTLADCLAELLSRDRMLGWRLVPTIVTGLPPTVTAITFTPFSRSPFPIVLPTLPPLPGNPISHTLLTAADPLTDLAISEDDTDLVNQVVVEGPREIGVCTLRFGHDLEKDWTNTQEGNIYNDGAKNEPGWNALSQSEQRVANERVRDGWEVDRVFRSLVIPNDWDAKADSSDPVFVDDYAPFVGSIEILDFLPLYREVDYQDFADEVDESSGLRYRDPLIMIELPGTGLYTRVETLGALRSGQNAKYAGLTFSLTAAPDNSRGPGIRLEVANGPAHAIAGPGFVGTTADVEQSTFYGFDYDTVIATVGLLGDRRPFYAIPSDAELGSADYITRRVIRIEDKSLQHIHIAAATVVDLDPDGDVLSSNGGVLRDPEPQLRAIALVAAEIYTKPNRRIDLRSSRMLSGIEPGHVIYYADGVETKATVVEIRIDAPITDGGTPTGDVALTITAAGERIDLMQLLRSPAE